MFESKGNTEITQGVRGEHYRELTSILPLPKEVSPKTCF